MKTTRLLILSNESLFFNSLLDTIDFEKNGIQVKLNPLLEVNEQFQFEEPAPQLILLDADNKKINIWVFLKSLKNTIKNVHIIILSSQLDDVYINHALELGVKGYVLKSSPSEILMGAIKVIATGKYFFDPGNTVPYRPQHKGKLGKLQKMYRLSSREAQIVLFIAEGLTSKQIADHLDLSFHTIETHRKNIYNKMEIKKVNELFKTLNKLEHLNEYVSNGVSPS